MRGAILALLLIPSVAEAAHPRMTVIGDSHGKGVAIALHRLVPEAFIDDRAVGGTASWQMPTAPDDGSTVFISAGTVDCGAQDPADAGTVDRILRVIGPYASWKNGGTLVFILPHDRLRGKYEYVNPRITKLRGLLTVAFTERHIPFVSMVEDPGEDGIHLTLEGYTAVAQRALGRVPGIGALGHLDSPLESRTLLP